MAVLLLIFSFTVLTVVYALNRQTLHQKIMAFEPAQNNEPSDKRTLDACARGTEIRKSNPDRKHSQEPCFARAGVLPRRGVQRRPPDSLSFSAPRDPAKPRCSIAWLDWPLRTRGELKLASAFCSKRTLARIFQSPNAAWDTSCRISHCFLISRSSRTPSMVSRISRVPPASSASPKCCRSFTSTTFAGAAPPRSQAENASAWLWRDLS